MSVKVALVMLMYSLAAPEGHSRADGAPLGDVCPKKFRTARELHEEWSYHIGNSSHESVFMTPTFRQLLPVDGQSGSTGYGTGFSPKIVDYFAEESSKECKSFATARSLNQRSLCPWHYVINLDSSRYPERLLEAVCNCDGTCSDGSPDTQCETVNYNIRVLKNSGECDPDGYYDYKPDWYSVPIGCACALSHSG